MSEPMDQDLSVQSADGDTVTSPTVTSPTINESADGDTVTSPTVTSPTINESADGDTVTSPTINESADGDSVTSPTAIEASDTMDTDAQDREATNTLTVDQLEENDEVPNSTADAAQSDDKTELEPSNQDLEDPEEKEDSKEKAPEDPVNVSVEEKSPLKLSSATDTGDRSLNKSGSDAGADLVIDVSPKVPKKRGRPPGSKSSSVTGSPQKKDAMGTSLSVSPTDNQIRKRINVQDLWLKPFAEGWRREIVLRNTYDGDKKRAADVYYYPPDKGKLRSSVQIGKYLETVGNVTLSTDCFTFVKETIHEEPAEFVRFAGKSTFGRPKSSPSKSPKTPVLKQKKSPFAKSPLLLKKTSMGLTSSPTSPKAPPLLVKLVTRTTSPGDVKPKFTIVKKAVDDPPASSKPSPQPPVIVVRPSVTTVPVSSTISGGPHYISVSPKLPILKKAVAKKHTGKRPGPPSNDDPVSKKLKVTVPFGGLDQQRLCGLDCPGRQGIPPSLHCTICMCMFHPECVNRGGHQRLDGFICKTCKAVSKKINVSKSANNNIITTGVDISAGLRNPLGPPPLTMPFPRPEPFKAGGPPPLKMGAGATVSAPPRKPPPLRMAPGSINTVLPMQSPPPLRVAGGTINIRPTMPVEHSNIPLHVLNQPTASMHPPTNGGVSNLGQIQSIARPMAPGPIQVTVPTTVPKDVSGQILALPSNVTSKLNMDKPVALKVNGQRYMIPPHCFINTQEGAKIYLPPGYLPSATTQGPANALSVNLNSNPSRDEQLLNITPLSEIAKSVTSKIFSKMPTASDKKNKPKTLFPSASACHIQQLHVGFDCMLHIFSYLGLKDLLRSHAVCKTWRRVATQHSMWKRIQLRDYEVTDWEKCTAMLQDMHTHTLDLRGLQHDKDLNRTWHQFTGGLPRLAYLRRIDFGQCPSTVLHAVTDKLAGLTALTAEFITDTTQEAQMWTSNAKLDIGKFCNIKDLEMLKLRGLCGLAMPAFSFSGGLSELGSLTKLRSLSLTTLRDVSEDEFSFLSTLTQLEELELGDLSSWKQETYDQLSSLTQLRSLRLECGEDFDDGGLGDALPNLSKLKNLELIKFAVSRNLVRSLAKVESIENLSIWPDTEHQAARVNTCTLRAVSEMTTLKQLDWGIMIDTTAPASQGAPSNQDDNSQDSNSSNSSGPNVASKQPDSVPILAASVDVLSVAEPGSPSAEDNVEYLSINQLVDRLCNHLPDTKIRVFKVPVVTPKVASKSS